MGKTWNSQRQELETKWEGLSKQLKEEKILRCAIKNGANKETIDFLQSFGQYLSDGELSTSQLRKFYGEVKRLQMAPYKESSFILLKPRLAYATGRANDGKDVFNNFYKVFSEAIDYVVEEERNGSKGSAFKNFISSFEAIVAYHKLAESNKN